MQADYKPFVDRMITRYEGGYGWNQRDPGGPTKYGITCYDLAEHRHETMTSMSAWAPEVRQLTLLEAEDIYKAKYATGVAFDLLPAGIDVAMFDYGVNSGPARPVRVARALLSLGPGRVDSQFLDKLASTQPTKFIDDLCSERLRFMHSIRGGSAWAEFGSGWNKRVVDLHEYAVHLVAGAAQNEAPDLTHVTQPKATHVAPTATKPTLGGAVATGGAMKASGFGWLPTALAVGVIVAGGIAYELYQERQAAAANAKVHL